MQEMQEMGTFLRIYSRWNGQEIDRDEGWWVKVGQWKPEFRILIEI